MSYEEALVKLKQRYDGYKFSENGKNMYNPFSLLNVFADGKMRNYWFATGTPTFLVDYLKKAYCNIPDLDGNVKINEAGLETYRDDAVNPLPILFQAGYVTIKDYNDFAGLYRLGFPNDEVRYGFSDNLLPAYTSVRSDKTGLSIWEFYEQIEAADIDGFMEKMKGIISGIPYDSLTEKDLALREQNYQTTVYLGTAEDALNRIREKGYADKYSGSGKKVTAVGASFDEEKRNKRLEYI